MLKQIPPGTKIFIDSNIFIYNFMGTSEACTNLLERVRIADVEGYTSTIVLAEVLHRLMIAEVVEKYDVKPKKVLRLLKEKPEVIPALKKSERAIQRKNNLGNKKLCQLMF